jgi:hypothetical protein
MAKNLYFSEYSCQSCKSSRITQCKNSIPGPVGVFAYTDCELRGNIMTCIYTCIDDGCNSTCSAVGDNYLIGKCVYDIATKKTSCHCFRD